MSIEKFIFKEKLYLGICKILFIINIIFWFMVAAYFSFFEFADNESYLILRILLFLEPVLFAIALWGLIKKNKIVYIFSLVFVFFNAILSITDQIGLYGIISLLLNILALVGLISIWKLIFNIKLKRG